MTHDESTAAEQTVGDSVEQELTPAQIVAEIESVNADNLRAAIEAILMITDVPLSIVAIATALDRPVNEVRDAVISLKVDYDGEAGQTPRGNPARRPRTTPSRSAASCPRKSSGTPPCRWTHRPHSA